MQGRLGCGGLPRRGSSIAAGQLGCTQLSGCHWPQMQLAAGCGQMWSMPHRHGSLHSPPACKQKLTGGCKPGPPSPGPAIAFSLKAAATAGGSCSSFTSHSCSSAGARSSYLSCGCDRPGAAGRSPVTPAKKLAEAVSSPGWIGSACSAACPRQCSTRLGAMPHDRVYCCCAGAGPVPT